MILRDPHPRWFRQFVSAVRLNAKDVELWAIADAHRGDVLAAAEACALHVRTVLGYRFEGAKHRILELEACRRRGFGACGDACAAIAAVVLMLDGECSLCYEQTRTLNSYAHVRMFVNGAYVDAFPDASLEVDRCAATEKVTRSGVRWPATAETRARHLLDERRRLAGPH